ncbi:MAG: 3-oxoadipate enol-lactonase [Alphaproteobacteria bacterium]|nr:3-oxoadipate enol-lactonase [Alphaproteobacteria bacterium]
MAFVRTGRFVTHYSLWGNHKAPVLVLGNSLGTNFHLWDAQLPALAARFRVLRYDMRGHGLTEVPDGVDAYTIDDLAGDVLALADALAIERFHYSGLSIGGMVGQRLGARAPGRVLSLALCDTAMTIAAPQVYRDRADAVRKNGLESIGDAVLQRWFTEGFLKAKPDIARGMRTMLTRNSVAGYAGCCLALAAMDLAADARRIACPTLVLVGARDEATPPAAARAIAAAVKGAKLVEIADCAHISPVERPAEVTAALTEFFASVGVAA